MQESLITRTVTVKPLTVVGYTDWDRLTLMFLIWVGQEKAFSIRAVSQCALPTNALLHWNLKYIDEVLELTRN